MFDRTLSRRTVLEHAVTAAASAGGLGLADHATDDENRRLDAATPDDDCGADQIVPDVGVVGARRLDDGADENRDVDYVAHAGDAVTFDAGETESRVPVESFSWTFETESLDGERVHHAFERGGRVASVTLSVTDRAGHSASTTARIAVRTRDRGNRAPTPVHDVSPTRTYDDGYIATVGERLTFDATDSIDADGDVVAYEWAFRRGVEEGAVVERAFRRAGNYEVTLSVTDDDGASESVDVPVHVTR